MNSSPVDHADTAAATPPVSDWVRRWSHLVPAGARALDLACGSGRHVRWLAQRGVHVTAVDRDAAALAPLSVLAHTRVLDLESGPWPLAGEHFDLVLVTNYLWRPRLPELLACVADGGLLIYETFAQGHERVGRPRNADFLLRPGELLDAVAGLRVLAYEDGCEPGDMGPDGQPLIARVVQRIVAQRPLPGVATPPPAWLTVPAPGGSGNVLASGVPPSR